MAPTNEGPRVFHIGTIRVNPELAANKLTQWFSSGMGGKDGDVYSRKQGQVDLQFQIGRDMIRSSIQEFINYTDKHL